MRTGGHACARTRALAHTQSRTHACAHAHTRTRARDSHSAVRQRWVLPADAMHLDASVSKGISTSSARCTRRFRKAREMRSRTVQLCGVHARPSKRTRTRIRQHSTIHTRAHMHGNACAPMDPAAEATCSDGCMSIVALPLRRRRARVGAASLGWSLVDHERFVKVGRVPALHRLACLRCRRKEGAVPPTHSSLQGRLLQSVGPHRIVRGREWRSFVGSATVPKGFKGTGEPESTGATYCAWHRIE